MTTPPRPADGEPGDRSDWETPDPVQVGGEVPLEPMSDDEILAANEQYLDDADAIVGPERAHRVLDTYVSELAADRESHRDTRVSERLVRVARPPRRDRPS